MQNIFRPLKAFSIFFLIFNISVLTNSQAQEVKPDDSFITIDTPHFEVIINAKQQELGQYYAKKLEESQAKLQKYFNVFPEKTIVIINDKTDITNGYATKVPYSHMMIFPVLPGPYESLSEFGDWNLELLSHEYAHILNFEPTDGFIKYLRNVFGTIISPNILLPNWWKEGLGVHIETAVSNKGRLRSVYQDAIIRSFVLKNNLTSFDIAEVNEIIPTWPEGMRPYIFGSIIWSQMTAEKGSQIVDTLNQRHGGRVPYFLLSPATDNFGMNYESVYNKSLYWVEGKAKDQIQKLKSMPPVKTKKFPIRAQYSSGPSISPDGKYMAMITVSETDKRQVKLYERKNSGNFLTADPWEADNINEATKPPKVLDAPPAGSIQRISWFPDSSQIIYDRVDAVNSVETFSDLHIYNLKTKKVTELTKAQRAREPSVSPTGENIAFVQLSASRTGLAVMNLQSKQVEILKTSLIGERISSPTFLRETQIVFSYRNAHGEEGLFIYDIPSKSEQRILEAYPDAKLPLVFQGQIFFISSLNGTFNIYTSSDFKSASPLSHTLTALYSPTVDPLRKDIYATEITENGHAVVLIDKKDQLKNIKSLPVIERLMAERYPATENKGVPAKTSSVETTYPVSEYSSLSHLWPHYWLPFFSGSSNGNGVVLQASTSGFDPLKKHLYQIFASWDSAVNRASFDGTYINSMTSTQYLIQSYQTNTYLGLPTYKLSHTGAVIGAAPDLWSLNRYTSGLISWRYQTTEFTGTTNYKRTGPSIAISYNDLSSSGEQISPESGKSGYISLTNYISNGDYVSHSQIAAGGNYYFSKWLPDRHAIMARINGIYTPEKVSSLLGVSTISLPVYQDTVLPIYMMRGYLNGQFVGRTLVNGNFEYRMPIENFYSGSGTTPLFFRRLHAAAVVDGVALDGSVYNPQLQGFDTVTFNYNSFWSAGAELRFETTLGYVLPLTFVVGVYKPMSPTYAKDVQTALSIQMSSVR